MFYKHKRLANEANNGAKLIKKYGDRVARGIMLKLTQLAAFQNVGEVPTIPPFTRHKLDGEYVGCYAIDVLGRRDGNRIVFELVDEAGSQIITDNLADVTCIKIVYIGDYH